MRSPEPRHSWWPMHCLRRAVRAEDEEVEAVEVPVVLPSANPAILRRRPECLPPAVEVNEDSSSACEGCARIRGVCENVPELEERPFPSLHHRKEGWPKRS